MKPLFLVDACASMEENRQSEEFVQSCDIIGGDASDEEVFELAKKLKVPVITFDKLFALEMILSNYPVIFRGKGKTYFIKPSIEEDAKYFDAVTYHIAKTNEVIIP